MSRLPFVLQGILLVGLLAVLEGCDPFHTTFRDTEPAVLYQAAELTPAANPTGSLKVMTYNIRFGAGRIAIFQDCYGNRTIMTEDEVRTNLEGLAAAIRAADPDVIYLQEADVMAKRSAYVDQVQYLLDRTDLNYGAYASQWKADYVPSDGLGPMDSGSAILSRWPLLDATRIALPLIGEQDGLVRYFYLRRNLLRAELDVTAAMPIYLLATHLSAYDTDGTRVEQLAIFEAEMNRLGTSGTVIGGGDLNSLPPGSLQVKDFSDAICTDPALMGDDHSMRTMILSSLYATFASAVPLADYQADNSPYFSFTAAADGFWNRKLDYLFTNGSWVPASDITYQDLATGIETMPLSDHCPLSAELALP